MNASKTLIGMAAALALSTGSIAFGQERVNPAEEVAKPTNPTPAVQNRDAQGGTGGDADAPGGRGTAGQPGTHSGVTSPAPGSDAANANNTNSGNTAMRGGSDQYADQQLKQIAASPEKATEKLFILDQGMKNQWEIAFSEAVASKSQDPQVKELAQMTARDHQKAQDQLRRVAQKHDMALPTQLPATKQQKLAILTQLPADKLDKCYLAKQKAAHAEAITSLSDHQQMLRDSDNAELKAYVDQTLPVVKQHAGHIVRVAQAKGIQGDITTIAASGNDAEAGMTAGADRKPMTPKASPVTPRTPGDRTAGDARE